MKYTKRIGLFVSAIILTLGMFAVSASAQRRGQGRVIVRPVIVRPYLGWGYNPFWRSDYWYDSFWNNPYYAYQREKQYREDDVKDEAKDLAKARQKYGSDGVITAKEQEKLAKAQREYDKAIRKLSEFNQAYRD